MCMVINREYLVYNVIFTKRDEEEVMIKACWKFSGDWLKCVQFGISEG